MEGLGEIETGKERWGGSRGKEEERQIFYLHRVSPGVTRDRREISRNKEVHLSTKSRNIYGRWGKRSRGPVSSYSLREVTDERGRHT